MLRGKVLVLASSHDISVKEVEKVALGLGWLEWDYRRHTDPHDSLCTWLVPIGISHEQLVELEDVMYNKIATGDFDFEDTQIGDITLTIEGETEYLILASTEYHGDCSYGSDSPYQE